MPGAEVAIVLVLVLAHVALVLHGASRHSAVFDEIVYPSSGYSYWTTGDYRLNREHPPLLKLLTGATWLTEPIDVRTMPGWADGDQWSFGQAMLYGPGRPHGRLLFRARAVIALLSALAALAIYRSARTLGGDGAGVAAVALWAFDPLVIAHAGLATTDLGAAALGFVGLLAASRALTRGGRLRIALAGALAGLALAAKFSNLVLLLPMAVAVWIVPTAHRRTALARTTAMTAVAIGVVVATYGPAGPAAFAQGLGMLRQHGELGHSSYAFGGYATHGRAWYFPAAWMVKTPVPLLLLTFLGWGFLAARFRRAAGETALYVVAPVAVLLAAMASSLNLGVRHLLPMVPFLAVAGGVVAAGAWGRGRAGKAVVAGLLLWLIAGTLRVHPDELAYANEPSGGPSRLWTHLADSNVDWGQDLPALADEVGRAPLRQLYLGYFGTADPAAYGLRYRWISTMRMIPRRFEDGPDPNGREWIAMSVTNLVDVYTKSHAAYDWLRHRPMSASPGYSIALYDITGDAEAHRKLGEVALTFGDAEAAEEPLRRALELAPDDRDARLELALALVRLGRPDDARAVCVAMGAAPDRAGVLGECLAVIPSSETPAP